MGKSFNAPLYSEVSLMAQATLRKARGSSHYLPLPYEELGDQTPVHSPQQDILQAEAALPRSGERGIEPTLFVEGRHCSLRPCSFSNLRGLQLNERRQIVAYYPSV